MPGSPSSSAATPAVAVTAHHRGSVSPGRGSGQPSVTEATQGSRDGVIHGVVEQVERRAVRAAVGGETILLDHRATKNIERHPRQHSRKGEGTYAGPPAIDRPGTESGLFSDDEPAGLLVNAAVVRPVIDRADCLESPAHGILQRTVPALPD